VGHPYCCPLCKQPLIEETQHYTCGKCARQYRQFAGIPNFKPQEIYPGEERVLEDIAQKYDRMSFLELLEYADSRPEKNILPWELRRCLRFASKDRQSQQECLANYTRDTIARPGADQMHVTLKLLGYGRGQNNFRRCLDIGCGRGPWAVAAAAGYKEIFALDMDMSSLVLARKYCQEQGLTNIRFLSASSSALPFAENYFDLVNSQAVLEHVDNQPGTLREIQRVLAPGGYFTGDSVNTWNLFTPEPHVNIRLIGFLPKSWGHKLSLKLRDFPYDDLQPLTYVQLQKMLRDAFGSHYQIIPFVELPQKSLTQSVMKRLPTGFLNWFTHTHYILAGKQG